MTKIASPFDLSAESLLIDEAGTSPTTTDLRGASIQGTAREWGALEYDSGLAVEKWVGRKFVVPFDLSAESQLINIAGTSPTTTDLRGASIQGAAREWGALEYENLLAVVVLEVIVDLVVAPRRKDCSLQEREIALVVETRDITLSVEGRD